MNEPIAHVLFVDGVQRPVYQEGDGRQYILDDAGAKVYGVWYLPAEEWVEPDMIISREGSPG